MRDHSANTRLNEREYRAGRIVLRSWPQVIDLGLTLKCNLRCEMCFSRFLPPIDLDRECLEKAIPYLKFCHRIVWNDAGELFASSRTPEFVDLMKRYHPPVSYVSTNFLLVDRYIDDILDSGLTDISVSVDGVRRETYERIRTGGKWDKLIANLELMQRKKAERDAIWPRLTFVFVAMRSNLAELPDFVRFAKKYGGVAVHVLRMLPSPTGLEKTEQPSLEEEKAAYCEALKVAREIGIEIQHTYFNNDVLLAEMGEPPAGREPAAETPPAEAAASPGPPPPPARVALETLHRRRFDPASGNVPICPSPWREFLIQTDGKVRACCFSPAVMGDLHEKTLPEIWNGPEYQAFRRRIATRDFSTCTGCPYLAKILAERGDPVETALVEIQDRAAGLGPRLANYAEDVDSLARFVRSIANRPLRQTLREAPGVLRTAVRAAAKGLLLKPALSRALAEQREINLRLIELLRLEQQRNRRLREDAEILAEVAALRAATSQDGEETPRPIASSPGQDPVDALFYSARFVRHATPGRLRAGSETHVPIAVRNTSAVAWPTEGETAVKLAYSWYYENGSLCLLDGLRTLLGPPLGPGETAEVEAVLRAPDRPGRYVLAWDLVYDPFAWFKDRGSEPLEVEVTIEP